MDEKKMFNNELDPEITNKDGTTESVKIQFEDGTTDWHSISEVSKMLYETDPTPNTFLRD